MRQFLSFVRKEFYHIFRDKRTMLILLGMPVVQIILFGFAITNEIKNSRIAVFDSSKDEVTERIIRQMDAGKYFNLTRQINTPEELKTAFDRGKEKLVVVFPQNFSRDLNATGYAEMQLVADATDPNMATTLANYAGNIVMDYQRELMQQRAVPLQIIPEVKMLYNPQLKGAYSAVPGVMGLILMLVCAMMTSVAIVREKELGTMEVLLVSPLKPVYIILAKAVPYLLLSFVNVLTIISLAVFVFDLPMAGSLTLLLGISTLYIITCLSLGLFISTVAQTQQTAMVISMMGLMLPTILLSGMMFPVENMPGVLRWLSNIVPAKWYIIIVKDVMIKGLGVAWVWKEVSVLLAITAVLVGASVLRFKTRLE